VQLASTARIFEINLHVARGSNLFSLTFAVHADADQLIARRHPRSVSRGTPPNTVRKDTLFGLDPLYAVPGWRLMSHALA
jgi:hypothetical protein